MLGTIALTIIVLAIIWVIFIEYRKEQKYKKQREEKRKLRKTPPFETNVEEPLKEKEKPITQHIEEEVAVAPEKVEIKPEPEVIVEEPKAEEKVEIEVTVAEELPPCDYPPFDHTRTVESLGLSEEEAKEFVCELVTQIDTHIPLIKKELETENFHQLEKLTHSIKGSATNLGTGGVSDLLVDFNTYLKTGTDMKIVQHYCSSLENYAQQLKDQYC
ncbi:Hpt domain-containing protein [Sulfurovum sp. zt1-1]|uniref:Hpt domain-containing protein n=1 Tax=Sulfurovum zhangzhouensis TaxID=3019067 RepID=A0ABT7QY42_9BACT|nr:Hpt domain-containing protein [Sulfurovum zhangzhouensis]MDM5271750.1 Hpt domain-containing protein [Sulfurovum zhangzhouensis]